MKKHLHLLTAKKERCSGQCFFSCLIASVQSQQTIQLSEVLILENGTSALISRIQVRPCSLGLNVHKIEIKKLIHFLVCLCAHIGI